MSTPLLSQFLEPLTPPAQKKFGILPKAAWQQIKEEGLPTSKTKRWRHSHLKNITPQAWQTPPLWRMQSVKGDACFTKGTAQELKKWTQKVPKDCESFISRLQCATMCDFFIIRCMQPAILYIDWGLPSSFVVFDVHSDVEIVLKNTHLGGTSLSHMLFYLQRSAHLKVHAMEISAQAQCRLGCTTFVQKSDSQLDYRRISCVPGWTRHEIFADLQEPNAQCRIQVHFGITDSSHCDHQVSVHHKKEQTCSYIRSRGLLGGQAHGVYNGRVQIDTDAEDSQSDHLTQNILLGSRAEVIAQPELDVHANRVQATHGATVGPFHPEELFFLNSRGVPLKQATHLIAQGVLFSPLREVPLPEVKKEAKALISRAALEPLVQAEGGIE